MQRGLRLERFQYGSQRRRYSFANLRTVGVRFSRSIVRGVLARADAVEHVAGAAAGLCKLHLAVPGDDNATAPSVDSDLDNPDLKARRMDAQAEAGQWLVEQEGFLALRVALGALDAL